MSTYGDNARTQATNVRVISSELGTMQRIKQWMAAMHLDYGQTPGTINVRIKAQKARRRPTTSEDKRHIHAQTRSHVAEYGSVACGFNFRIAGPANMEPEHAIAETRKKRSRKADSNREICSPVWSEKKVR